MHALAIDEMVIGAWIAIIAVGSLGVVGSHHQMPIGCAGILRVFIPI